MAAQGPSFHPQTTAGGRLPITQAYGRLLEIVEQAFEKEKPLFSLAIYYPLAYYEGPDMSSRNGHSPRTAKGSRRPDPHAVPQAV